MNNDSEEFIGETLKVINPRTEMELSKAADLEEIRTTDTSEFMKKAGAGFVSEQYHDIQRTNDRIDALEQILMEKAGKGDANVNTIETVYKLLTKKNDNNAKNVLRLYQGNNAESSPLLKKGEGGETGVAKVAGEASAENLSMMSNVVAIMAAMANKDRGPSIP